MTARALSRLGSDFSAGLARIPPEKPGDEDYHAAANLLAVSLWKEKAALESCRAIGPAAPGEISAADEAISERKAALEQAAREMQALLYSAFRASAGREAAPFDDPALARLAGRVPRKASRTLDEWMDLQTKVAEKREEEARAKRDERERLAEKEKPRKAKGPGKEPKAKPDEPEPQKLSNLMQFAAMNWIDGKTDAAEIARRVAAEALSAGAWYYGEATPAMVEQFLEKQAKDGLIVW